MDTLAAGGVVGVSGQLARIVKALNRALGDSEQLTGFAQREPLLRRHAKRELERLLGCHTTNAGRNGVHDLFKVELQLAVAPIELLEIVSE